MEKQTTLLAEPQLIEGGIAVDDRGQLQFCNGFQFQGVQRFYAVSNHRSEFIRAWHGHKKETKYVLVISGAAIVCAVPVDDWDKPDRKAKIYRYVLSENKPHIVKIPAGYANGFKTLTQDTKVMFFSTSTLNESLDDDYRFAADYWNPWNIEER